MISSITQEKLAAYCEVSTRTIQHLESGEVEPRAYTPNSSSNILEFDFGQDNTENESFWLVVLHMSNRFVFVLDPLLLWLWKKNQSCEIDRQGQQVLNFQITMTLVMVSVVFVLMLAPVALAFLGDAGLNAAEGGPIFMLIIMCGTMPLILIGIFCFYQAVANTMRALSDQPTHYPLSIQFMK